LSNPGLKLALPILVGRSVRLLARLRGGGSAFPGLVTRKLAPTFIADTMAQLPHGVVVVLGSNGKSTTTNILTAIMREHGLRVFTNPSGANLPQGIASSLLAEVSLTGKLKADVGVIEVDEAFGEVICRELKPTAAVILNLQIDQIYRFFEPERVAQMFRDILAQVSKRVVLNRDDNFLRSLAHDLSDENRLDVSFFGASPEVVAAAPHGQVLARDYGNENSDRVAALNAPFAEVVSLDGNNSVIRVGGVDNAVRLPVRGLHYAVDTAGAISLAAAALGDTFSLETAIRAVQEAKTVYGRGEVLKDGDIDIEILLLKNLASLQLNLDYLEGTPDSVLFALDAGSKDPSWLYAADLSRLGYVDVVSGPKAAFVALRLAYEGIEYGTIEPDVVKAVQLLQRTPAPASGTRTLILDYDQMLLTRKHLGYKDLEAGAA